MSAQSPRLFFLFSVIGFIESTIAASAAQVIAVPIFGSHERFNQSILEISATESRLDSGWKARDESEEIFSIEENSAGIAGLVTIPPVSLRVSGSELLVAIRGGAGADGYWYSKVAAPVESEPFRKGCPREWSCHSAGPASDPVALVVGVDYWDLYRISEQADAERNRPITNQQFFRPMRNDGFRWDR